MKLSESLKFKSPVPRSFTPTIVIESPKITLANYKLMAKKTKPVYNKFNSEIASPVTAKMFESVFSTDTCIFAKPAEIQIDEVEILKEQLRDMKEFTKFALESQQKHFEGIIERLEREIQQDNQKFFEEINRIKLEIESLQSAKGETTEIMEKSKVHEYQKQYVKNKEYISILQKRNQEIFEKIFERNL